jgi:hypothetical protein
VTLGLGIWEDVRLVEKGGRGGWAGALTAERHAV